MPLNIVSVLPTIAANSVILQGAVIVTFNGEIDTTTYSEASFLVSAPPEMPALSPDTLIGGLPPVSGADYVDGVFSFALNAAGATIATFKPARPLRPNVKYTVLITTGVQLLADESPLSSNYTWSFTTGVLNLTIPPPQNPLPSQVGRIQPSDLLVSPASTLNNDLHLIEITFPSPLDPASFQVNSILVDLEAFLQDLDVVVPRILTQVVSINPDNPSQLLIALTF